MCLLEPGEGFINSCSPHVWALKERKHFPEQIVLRLLILFAFDSLAHFSCERRVQTCVCSFQSNMQPQNYSLTYSNPLCSILGRLSSSSCVRSPSFESIDNIGGSSRARLGQRLGGSSCWIEWRFGGFKAIEFVICGLQSDWLLMRLAKKLWKFWLELFEV